MTTRRAFVAGTAVALFALGAGRRAAALPLLAPSIRITFDAQAVALLLDLVAAKDASDGAVRRLLDLPAYRNIARVGTAEGSTTPERLAASAKAVISGTATERDQPRGAADRLLVTDPDGYRVLLKDVEATKAAREARVVARLSAFLPPKVRAETIAQTVYLHLGGTWDALNVAGDIYLNLAYWHDYNKSSLDGLNLVVAHEMTHTLQNRAYGNPEAQDTGAGAWLTALSKIQREGTARLVETDTDTDGYAPYTYGFFYRAVDNESARDFAHLVALLEPLRAACLPTFDKERFASLYGAGMDNGGPFYTIGYGAAKAIDERAGRKILLETMEGGPKVFWTQYADLCRKFADLPRLPGGVEAAVRGMGERL